MYLGANEAWVPVDTGVWDAVELLYMAVVEVALQGVSSTELLSC